jgi:hypothetical protein
MRTSAGMSFSAWARASSAMMVEKGLWIRKAFAARGTLFDVVKGVE